MSLRMCVGIVLILLGVTLGMVSVIEGNRDGAFYCAGMSITGSILLIGI